MRASVLKMSALLMAWLLLFLVPGSAAAEGLFRVKLEDLKKKRVTAGLPTTYADLLQLVFPEPASGEKNTTQTPPVRSLNGSFKAQPLTAKYNPDWGFVDFLDAQPLKAQGRPLLLLLIPTVKEIVEGEVDDEGDSIRHLHLLALFQTTPTPKLLDLLDIGQGWTMGMIEGFMGKNPLINLTPGTQACIIFQEHFNSSENFNRIHLLWVYNQRLEKIFDVLTRGWKNSCDEVATKTVFRTGPDKGREFPRVVAKLTLRVKPAPGRSKDCKPPALNFTRSYQGCWRWNPTLNKYIQTSGNLDQLDDFYDYDDE